jgi:hypothetical protein
VDPLDWGTGTVNRAFTFHNPFDRSTSILQFNESTATVDSPLSEKILPSGSKDAYFTGIAIDRESSTVYYTTQKGIYVYDENTKLTTSLIAGIVEVKLAGFNLGNSVSDLLSIKVNGRLCTSVLHYSSTMITCILTLKDTFVNEAITEKSIHVSTRSGSVVGISDHPEVQLRSQSRRPIISTLDWVIQPFCPYNIYLSVDNFLRHGASVTAKTLYWSNTATGSHSVQRSMIDGSQVETVVNNVEKGVALHVLTALFDVNMSYMQLNDATETVEECTNEGLPVDGIAISTDNTCVVRGHLLLYLDAQRGHLAVSSLPLINPQRLYQPYTKPVTINETAENATTFCEVLFNESTWIDPTGVGNTTAYMDACSAHSIAYTDKSTDSYYGASRLQV